MLQDMVKLVERFQIEILDYPIPQVPTKLTKKQTEATWDHLGEELDELRSAKDLEHQADALIDFIYVALGALVKMGLAPMPLFQEVHRANMCKIRGEVDKRPNNEGYDAVKPTEWTPPLLEPYLKLTAEKIHYYDQQSPIFSYLTQLRINKGEDYNASDIEIDDYMPFGEESYVQMVYLKALRMVALCKKAQNGGAPNYEGLPGSLVDLLNYASFFGEWMIKHGMLKDTVIQTDREKEAS